MKGLCGEHRKVENIPKNLPFFLDKNRGGAAPLGKMSRENFLIGGTADVQPPMVY